jgi:hypothetical protein
MRPNLPVNASSNSFARLVGASQRLELNLVAVHQVSEMSNHFDGHPQGAELPWQLGQSAQITCRR